MGTKRTRICRAAVTAIALMICFGIAVEAAGVTTIGENHLDGTFEIMRRASRTYMDGRYISPKQFRTEQYASEGY